MYVKTDYDGCPYITAGKVYEVDKDHEEYGGWAYITADNKKRYLLFNAKKKTNLSFNELICLHGKGTWIICDKDGNEVDG